MINTLYKPKGSRIWRWKFRLHPADGRIEDISLGTSDKQVAGKKRAELLREREHERAGFIPPKAARDAAQRNLAEHLSDCHVLSLPVTTSHNAGNGGSGGATAMDTRKFTICVTRPTRFLKPKPRPLTSQGRRRR